MSSEDSLTKSGFLPPSNMQRFAYPGDSNTLHSSPGVSRGGITSQTKTKISKAPPPLPPRPEITNSLAHSSRYPGMSMGYGVPFPMSYGSYGARGLPYSSYNGFGGYPRSSYSSNMYGAGSENNLFVQMAEESSRPAFQSIESMVNAVGSISMMLESTYFAVYSSYRAVLGVVDQFSRLKNHLAHVISTLALIRALQWLCQRVLHLLGLRKMNPSAEAAWSAASNVVKKTDPSSNGPDAQTSWPIFMFMGLVFGAPWLIFRIFSKMASKKAKEILQPHDLDQRRVVALYEFQAARSNEISMSPGQVFYIAPRNLQPKSAGWCLVYNEQKKSGLVPTNYLRKIKLLNKVTAKNNDAVHSVNEGKEFGEPSIQIPVEQITEEANKNNENNPS